MCLHLNFDRCRFHRGRDQAIHALAANFYQLRWFRIRKKIILANSYFLLGDPASGTGGISNRAERYYYCNYILDLFDSLLSFAEAGNRHALQFFSADISSFTYI